jgi:serine protease Do
MRWSAARCRRAVLWCVLSGISTCLCTRASSDDGPAAGRALETTLVDVITRAEKSVVSVARMSRPQGDAGPRTRFDPLPAGGPSDPAFIPTDFGSGVILAGGEHPDERYILTAAHVVLGRRGWSGGVENPAGGTTITVRLATRHLVTAELLAADPRSDLAMLRLPLAAAGVPLEAAPPFALSDGPALQKGRLVIALGNPYAIARDGSASASLGMVSNISRKPWPPRGALVDPTDEDLTIHHYGTLLTIDARLNLGGSGGALVDLDGQLVGLTTALAALEGYEKSAGYAIPIDAPARQIIDSLRQGFEVEYGFLGIQPGEADAEQMQRLSDLTTQATAARIRRIVPGSPAERVGLAAGDIILAVNGQPVYSDVDLIRDVGWLGPGVDARLDVVRPEDRREFQVDCRLAKWPVYDDSMLVTTRERHPAWRGLHIDYATSRRRYLPANPLAAFPQGVVVSNVDPGSPAAAAGLTEGVFITKLGPTDVASPADFATAIADLKGDVSVVLGEGRTVTITE